MNPTHVPAALRRHVRQRASNCCEYCLLAEEDAFFTHEPDHVIAEKHGGATSFENLAWACFDCNRFKGSDIASLDPLTGELVPLFDPRTQVWHEHFELIGGGTIHPLTPIGRATEHLLKLNLDERVEARNLLAALGRYAAFPSPI